MIQTHLYVQADFESAQFHEAGPGQVGVFTMRGPGVDGANEDAAALFVLDTETAVLVVADGVGGLPAGQDAARIALEQMQEFLKSAAKEELRVRNAILNGFESANRAVREMGVNAATTMVAVELQGSIMRCYHVGDSAALMVGQRGRLKWQTISHSPVGHAVEAGVLDEADAMHHEERHLVSNLVGSREMRIEIGPSLSIARRDTILLATDGLFDNLHTEEITARIRKGSLEKACKALATTCRNRMLGKSEKAPSKPDNASFIVFRLRAHKPG